MSRTNIVLLVLLIAVALFTIAGRIDYSQPNIEVLPDMKYTPASLAYQENAVFANRRTLQRPVEGTIARGQMPLHFAATKEDAVRAGEEIKNPYAQPDVKPEATQGSVARGAQTYRTFCVACHGATGTSDGQVTKRGFPPPPPLLTGKSLQMKDGQLFHILTYGQGSMADFAGQLTPQRRWDAINHVRDMQQKAAAAAQAEQEKAAQVKAADEKAEDLQAPATDSSPATDEPTTDTDVPEVTDAPATTEPADTSEAATDDTAPNDVESAAELGKNESTDEADKPVRDGP